MCVVRATEVVLFGKSGSIENRRSQIRLFILSFSFNCETIFPCRLFELHFQLSDFCGQSTTFCILFRFQLSDFCGQLNFNCPIFWDSSLPLFFQLTTNCSQLIIFFSRLQIVTDFCHFFYLIWLAPICNSQQRYEISFEHLRFFIYISPPPHLPKYSNTNDNDFH